VKEAPRLGKISGEYTETTTADAAAQEAAWDGRRLPPGARGAMAAFAGALVMLAVPYVVTEALPEGSAARAELQEWRAWVPGDPVPFVHIFAKHEKVVHVDDPTGGGEAEVPDMPALVLAPDPIVVVPPDAGPTVAAGPDAGDPGTAGDAGPNEPAPAPAPAIDPVTRIKIPPETWDGLTTFIEDPSGVMPTFYASLAKVALKEPGAKVRISHWGDSALAADGMTGYARRLLQKTFGDGGHGYAMLAAANPWYRRKDIEWFASGWQAEEFIRDNAADQRYGFGGASAVGYAGARSVWRTVEGPPGTTGTAASEVHVYYLADKGGGRLSVKVDKEEVKVIDTRVEDASKKEDRVEVVTFADGAHEIEVRNSGGGRTKVYGVAIERASGVVYDGMGVVGARDARWLQADPEHLVRALAQRSPDLAILMYGGNQLVDSTTMDWYTDKLTEVLRLWKKGLGGKACLVMSPIDHGERYRGRIRTVPRQLDIMKVQRTVALAEGCAWFSIYDAMGGDGSIGKWYNEGLANADLAHPTGKGSVELGALWYKAVMHGFADWIEARKKATGAGPTP